MNAIVQFVVRHGYSILFAAIFAHQIGLPVPAPLFLLAAGALAAAGKLSLVAALGLAVIACVLADWLWYEAGRAGRRRSCTSFTASRQILEPPIAGRERSLPSMGLRFSCWASSSQGWTR